MGKLLVLLTDYIRIKGLTKSYAPLLYELISVKTNDGKLIVNASLKRDIGSRINATVGSIDNMITKLIEAGILHRLDRGMYIVCNELEELNLEEKDDIVMKVTYNDETKTIMISGGRAK